MNGSYINVIECQPALLLIVGMYNLLFSCQYNLQFDNQSTDRVQLHNDYDYHNYINHCRFHFCVQLYYVMPVLNHDEFHDCDKLYSNDALIVQSALATFKRIDTNIVTECNRSFRFIYVDC